MSDGGAPLCRTEVRPRVGDTSGWTLELREARRSPKEKSTRGGLDVRVVRGTEEVQKGSRSEVNWTLELWEERKSPKRKPEQGRLDARVV